MQRRVANTEAEVGEVQPLAKEPQSPRSGDREDPPLPRQRGRGPAHVD